MYREKDIFEPQQDVNDEAFYFQKNTEYAINLEGVHSKLKRLYIVGLPLKNLKGLKSLTNLTELWSVECLLEEIDVSKFIKVRRLYLYSNNLDQIPILDKLKNLEILWLANNQISSLKNLELIPQLRELNVGNNLISQLENGFKYSPLLETLNLAGNPICSMDEILNLQSLPNLMNLILYDPLYDVSPIVTLNNYRPYVLYSLPHLGFLDQFEVDEQELQLVNTFFISKEKHYSMLSHKTISDYYARKAQKLQETNNTLQLIKIEYMNYILKEFKAENENDKTAKDQLKWKMEHLHNQILSWDTKMEQWNYVQESLLEIKLKQIDLEFEYFGNFNTIEHHTNSSVARMCQNVMSSFVCPLASQNIMLQRIEVDRVTEIVTAVLDPFLPLDCLSFMFRESKDKFESFYLLLEPFGTKSFSEWPFEYIHNKLKFKEREDLLHKVTDCISVADPSWLNLNELNKTVLLSKEGTFCNRTALLCYLNYGAVTVKENLKNYSGVHKPKSGLSECDSNSQSEGCCLLKVLSPEDIHPVFVVEFHYVFQEKLKSKDEDITSEHGTNIKIENYQSFIVQTLEISNWNALINLNLEKQYISTFGSSKIYENLKVLDISFNKIHSFQEVCSIFPSLITLNAAFNSISSLCSMTKMVYLQKLDLSWNNITNLINAFEILNTETPSLKNLCLNYNPVVDVYDKEKSKYLVHTFLPNLEIYNNENDCESYCHKTSLDDLDDIQVIYNRTETEKRKLSLLWNGRKCVNGRSKKGSHLVYKSESRIASCLYLCKDKVMHDFRPDQTLNKLCYLTLSHVGLSSTKFLSSMALLKEIDLSGNILTQISLSSLQFLQKLNLSDNHLTSLICFETVTLPSIKLLDLTKNSLTSLTGLQKINTLTECYLSLNTLSKLSEIDVMKTWNYLRIVDLSYNQFGDYKGLRKLIVFILPKIEYVNGEAVHDSDVIEALNTLGSYLDTDYLTKSNHSTVLHELKELTIRKNSLRKAHLDSNKLRNLASINLENNSITELSGFSWLFNLKTLCLSSNQVTSWGDGGYPSQPFPSLQIIHLDNNGIQTIEKLELYRIPYLTTLFLQDNHINCIGGLKGMKNLRHLILDRNKLKTFEFEENNEFENLLELYLEGNLIQDIDFIKNLPKMKRMFLANNQISDLDTLKNIKGLPKLKELSVNGNPICRSTNYYKIVLMNAQTLRILDGHIIEINPVRLFNGKVPIPPS